MTKAQPAKPAIPSGQLPTGLESLLPLALSCPKYICCFQVCHSVLSPGISATPSPNSVPTYRPSC